jgi:hypothetical protein
MSATSQSRKTFLTQGSFSFVAAFVLVAAVGAAGSADAAYLRGTASLCTPAHLDAGAVLSIGDFVEGGTANVFYCPFVEYGDFTKDDVATLNVYVDDEDVNGVAYAYACWSDFSGNAYDCLSGASNSPSSNTGHFTLTPPVTDWDTPMGHAYIRIVLPENSRLEGFYASS